MDAGEGVPEADAGQVVDLGPIEELTDLERFTRYVSSDISLQRLIVSRDIASIAKVLGLEDSLQHVVPSVPDLLQDNEVAVRQTMAEQIPSLAAYLVSTNNEDAYSHVKGSLLTALTGALSDFHTQVREAGAAAVVSLAEHLKPEDRQERIAQLLLDLSRADDAEKRMVSAQLMNQLAKGLGSDVVKDQLVPELARLAEDQMFRVRKNVALHMDQVCQALGPELSAEHIWPLYTQLSKDEIWGVRKACAESIVGISRGLSQEMRGTEVLDLFQKFADDVSRWVRNCVFQQLGPLIATLKSEQVSKELVATFTAMSDTKDPRWEETDMQSFCAFNFPAVALTVGRSRWSSELSDAYHILVFGVHEKVRRSLSHSLHEIAIIVGTEIAESNLLSVFELFLRDLDEVKAGVLKNLAKLLAVLSPPFREKYLHVLTDIQENETEHWRFRRLLAGQLDDLAALYSPTAVSGTIVPLAIKLCQDPVSAVRVVAHQAVGSLIGRVASHGDNAKTDEALKEVLAFAGEKSSFHQRQTYVNCCMYIAQHVEEALFVRELLPLMVKLSQDRVPNVRVAVAQAISHSLATGKLTSRKQDLTQILRTLQDDTDSDVRYHASRPLSGAAGTGATLTGAAAGDVAMASGGEAGLGQLAHEAWNNEL
eukprot:TRINITY_DN8953_c0_g1_i1.p1 TRINITY_DN8953_c0_g1~~TRINITY_DN8953_c0_g1_i1.p1  ORF type:complete len:652 (+),score=113.34 TRINITY_DN8953_c0_g1_i1:332-2287(+)